MGRYHWIKDLYNDIRGGRIHLLYRNSRLCFKIQRNHEGFKRNGEHDDYTQSAEEVFKCQFSDLLSVKFCQFIFLIQLKFFVFQVKCMSLLMLPFGAFKFLWANAVVIKCGGECK